MTPTKKRKTPPTAKERVLARYPTAFVVCATYCYDYHTTEPAYTAYATVKGCWWVLSEMCKTESAAWADAAKRLKERK